MKNKWNDKIVFTAIVGRVIDALEVSAKLVEDNAKLLCPVDTGRLRESIIHKVDQQELIAKVGTPVEYAPFIEFGTGEHAENGQGRKGGWFYTDDKGETHFTYGNKPQPFLRPALYNNINQINRIFKDAFK